VALVSHRTGRVNATQDENADGVIDRRDDEIAARHVSATYAAGSSEPVSTSSEPARYRDESAVRATASPVGTLERPAPAKAPVSPDATTISRDDTEVVTTPVGPRPRASGFATLSLIVSVLAVVAVATGGLAGPGIALGAIAALLAFGGIAATSRRHVAGKSDALLGMFLGLAAVVVGVLCVTGNLPWLTTNTNLLDNLQQWIQTHASWMLPNR